METTRLSRSDEFHGILMSSPGTPKSRPVMSMPARLIASKKFIQQVQVGLSIEDEEAATAAADWIIDKMERFGARTAQGVFDMKGNGPQCSWCGAIWPLCGHQHQSEVLDDEEEDHDEPHP